MMSRRFFFPTHSALTPPDPLHRLTRLLTLHWLIMVVSPPSQVMMLAPLFTRSVSPRVPLELL